MHIPTISKGRKVGISNWLKHISIRCPKDVRVHTGVGIINIYTAADKESPELNSSLINTYTLIIKIRIGSPTIRTIH